VTTVHSDLLVHERVLLERGEVVVGMTRSDVARCRADDRGCVVLTSDSAAGVVEHSKTADSDAA